MSPREIEKLGKLSDPKTQSEGEEEMRDLEKESPMALGVTTDQGTSPLQDQITQRGIGPLRFITWNLNGLATRMKLLAKVGELVPDVIALQEVRLECEEGSPGEVKRGSKDEAYWKAFIAPFLNRV